MAMLRYTAKVQDTLHLELPQEAIELGLEPGDQVGVTFDVPHHPSPVIVKHSQVGKERAAAYRIWAKSHSRNMPNLSDEDISRESIYGERG